jgi:hypothetical protein
MGIDKLLMRSILDMRKALHGCLFSTAKFIGIYRPFSEFDLQLEQVCDLLVSGVPTIGEIVSIEKYANSRKVCYVGNAVATPSGAVWSDGVLERRLSFRSPSVLDFVRSRNPVKRTLQSAILLHAQTPTTYGDWVAQCLMPLCGEKNNTNVVAVPSCLFRKSYFQRDIKKLGFKAFEIAESVLIKDAIILPQVRPVSSFDRDDVLLYRRAFGIEPPVPRRRSLVYLSRRGEKSEGVQRNYPSQEVSNLIRDLGGHVVEVRDCTFEDFLELASECETVVADHGSAMCNMLLWDTHNVIELFTMDWWNKYFACLAYASGVPNYAAVNIDGCEGDYCRQIENLVREPVPITTLDENID